MKYEFSEEFLHTMGDLLAFCAEKGTDTIEMTFKVDNKSEGTGKQ